MTSSLRRRSAYAFLGVLAQGGFRVLANVLIGRFAGAGVLGQSAGLLASGQLLSLMGPTSLAAAQTRYVALGPSDGIDPATHSGGVARHVRNRVLLVSTALILPLALGWSWVSGSSIHETSILLAFTLGLIAYGSSKSYLLGLGRFQRLAASEIGTAVVGLAAVVGLISLGVRDLNLLWPLAGAAWLSAALNWIRTPKGNLRHVPRREIDRFAALGVIGTLVSAGFMQMSVILASTTVGGKEAGFYAAAFALATPLSLVTTSLGMVLFPTFASLVSDELQTKRVLEKALRAMITVLVPGLILLMVLAPEVTRAIWGPGYGPTSVLLPLMMCAIGMNGVGMPASQALTSTGVSGMRDSVFVGLLGMGTGVVTWLLTVPQWGVLGLAVGYFAGTAVTSSLPVLLMSRRLKAPLLLHLIGGWSVPAAAAVLSAVLVAQGEGIGPRLGAGAISILGWFALHAVSSKVMRRKIQ